MLLSLHGQTKDAFRKTKSSSWEYDVIEPLYKYNMTDVAAALGNSQLQRYEKMLARRHEIIRKYDEAFAMLSVNTLNHYLYEQISSGHLYFLKIKHFDENKRNFFIERMADKGISCNVHYKPLPMLSAYINHGFDIKEFPKAYDYYKDLVTLPLYSTLTDEEVEYIVHCVKEVLTDCYHIFRC